MRLRPPVPASVAGVAEQARRLGPGARSSGQTGQSLWKTRAIHGHRHREIVMETLNYMFAGYLVIWALAFGLVFSMWARSRRLEGELQAVRQLVEELDREDT